MTRLVFRTGLALGAALLAAHLLGLAVPSSVTNAPYQEATR